MRDEVGQYVGEGIGTGIIESAKSVMRDVDRFSAQISGGFDIHAGTDLATPAFEGSTGVTNTVTVNQTVQKPEGLADLYIAAKRGARAGFAGA
jgi:hypothetical protein